MKKNQSPSKGSCVTSNSSDAPSIIEGLLREQRRVMIGIREGIETALDHLDDHALELELKIADVEGNRSDVEQREAYKLRVLRREFGLTHAQHQRLHVLHYAINGEPPFA